MAATAYARIVRTVERHLMVVTLSIVKGDTLLGLRFALPKLALVERCGPAGMICLERQVFVLLPVGFVQLVMPCS